MTAGEQVAERATRLKCACADLWAHPAAQLLAGPALHPGGGDLTGRLLDSLALSPGARVLDVGSGTGVALAQVARRGAWAAGLDYSPVLAAQAADAGPVAVGDAECLPWRDGAFDAALAECVVSTLPDKAAALAELHRVLRPGAGLGLSDVTTAGTLPEPLASVAGWAACVGGAQSVEGYTTALGHAGFVVHDVDDVSSALTDLVDQIQRRVGMLLAGVGAGVLDDVVAAFGGVAPVSGSTRVLGDLVVTVADQARAAVADGRLGYAVVTAVRD